MNRSYIIGNRERSTTPDKKRCRSSSKRIGSNNISVCVRIRPINHRAATIPIQCDTKTIMIEDEFSRSKSYTRQNYTFDRVFSPEQSNFDIYKEALDEEIDRSLQGFNTTLLMYGITGSGKTHTVFGSLNAGDIEGGQEPGVIYYCFKKLRETENCSIKLSYIEIYNEQVKDLLGSNDSLNIVETISGEVMVPGVSIKEVGNFNSMLELVKCGNKRRKMAKTSANSFSSRSHAIVTLYITRDNEATSTSYQCKVNFIDLAGCERVDTTSNKGRIY